ncbi:hypothetical protein D4765_15470 [Subtercola vilae]|uniref:Uncharacterized protein n=1 Tax=Subtercola vilae TaxID=2056433 RepID=A0A4T2BP03_9MICO|nr:hypothetical protein D4765_15470 [Subtercola vilae]
METMEIIRKLATTLHEAAIVYEAGEHTASRRFLFNETQIAALTAAVTGLASIVGSLEISGGGE